MGCPANTYGHVPLPLRGILCYHLGACLATTLGLALLPTPAGHLQTSIAFHLHVPRPAACLLSSQSPYLYTSTSLHLQRTPRAPQFHTSIPPTRPYVCTTPPEFQISIPLRLHVPRQMKLMIWTENGEVVGGKRALVCGGRHAGRGHGRQLNPPQGRLFCSHRLMGS